MYAVPGRVTNRRYKIERYHHYQIVLGPPVSKLHTLSYTSCEHVPCSEQGPDPMKKVQSLLQKQSIEALPTPDSSRSVQATKQDCTAYDPSPDHAIALASA